MWISAAIKELEKLRASEGEVQVVFKRIDGHEAIEGHQRLQASLGEMAAILEKAFLEPLIERTMDILEELESDSPSSEEEKKP